MSNALRLKIKDIWNFIRIYWSSRLLLFSLIRLANSKIFARSFTSLLMTFSWKFTWILSKNHKLNKISISKIITYILAIWSIILLLFLLACFIFITLSFFLLSYFIFHCHILHHQMNNLVRTHLFLPQYLSLSHHQILLLKCVDDVLVWFPIQHQLVVEQLQSYFGMLHLRHCRFKFFPEA